MLILSAIALFAGLASGIAEAQAPTPTPSGAPTPTPPPLAWYEGDKAPWVVAFVLGALGVVAGIVLRPSLEAIGEALKRWLQALGFGFEKRYLDALVEKHRYLKFVGVRDRTKAGRPKLEDVYISLQMGAPTQMDATAVKPAELTLGEALRANKNLVILGEPGAGKSTLLRYLVLTFAGIVPVSRLGLNEKRLPIYVRLKDCIGNETPISEILTAPPTLPVSKSPPAFFEGRLRHGQCLVLLDGLDEVVDEGQKKSSPRKSHSWWATMRVIVLSLRAARPGGIPTCCPAVSSLSRSAI